MKRQLLLFFLLSTAFFASAQTYVNVNATGTNDGSSWENAYSSLEDALLNTTSGDIWVANGTYVPSGDTLSSFEIKSDVNLYGSFTGTESSTDERDFEAGQTTLSGDHLGDDIDGSLFDFKEDNSRTILYVDSLLESVIIDGFIFSGGNGRALATGDEKHWAGAAVFTYSTIQVLNSEFHNNFSRRGAAICISAGTNGGDNSIIDNCLVRDNGSNSQSTIFINSAENVTVQNSTFEGNNSDRGGVYPIRTNNFKLLNCSFEENADNGGWGGAFFSWNNSNLLIDNCEFIGNSTTGSAGVMYVDGREDTLGVNTAENFIIRNSTFEDNSTDNFGGAIYTWEMSMSIENCSFTGNRTAGSGDAGAVANYGNSGKPRSFVIQNSSFEQNFGNFGGALVCGGAGATFDFTNSTFTANRAFVSGGSMLVGFGANANYTDCTFVRDSANFGGSLAFQNDGVSSITNCSFSEGVVTGNGACANLLFDHTLSVEGSVFELNLADQSGGVFNASRDNTTGPGSMSVTNSIFTNNGSGLQGAIFNLANYDLDIENSVFAFNVNNGEGAGGVVSANATDSLTMTVDVTNSTFYENFANIGSSIGAFTDDTGAAVTVNLQNNIFNESQENSLEIEGGSPSFVSAGGNISSDNSGADILTATNDINEATSIKFNDPDDLNFRLNQGSQAINNGIVTGAPTTDIEGNPRIMEPESGAYEYDPITSLNEEIIENNMLAIFPNPVGQVLNFELENEWTGKLSYEIHNSSGSKVLTGTIDKSQAILTQSINVENLQAGNYYLIIKTNYQAVVGNMIKL